MTAENEGGKGERGYCSEATMTRQFALWRDEFRSILEDHRKDIQNRLEKIEREIEKKSDKEYVELLVLNLKAELDRHTEDIRTLFGRMNRKLNTDTMWKIIGFVTAIGGVVGGVIGFVISCTR